MMTTKSLWKEWLTSKALPLWGEQGFDASRNLYHECLNFDYTPLHLKSLRLMVQARQIATFCQAYDDKLYYTADHAQSCLDRVEKLYYQPDNQTGWIFSICPDGSPANSNRDLYAHAFILFAYACSYKQSKNINRLHMARQTIKDIEVIFSTDNGGFFDSIPENDDIRRQNPHMHLVEAYLTLFEVSQDEFYLDKAKKLISFSLDHFTSKNPTMLIEFFTKEWNFNSAPNENQVEPGHLFEWAWLLKEFNRLSTLENSFTNKCQNFSSSFFKNGHQYGMDNLTVFGAMTENGTLTDKSYRIWPQTELMRLLARHVDMNKNNRSSLLKNMTKHFFEHFAPTNLQGGWIDRFHEDGKPATNFMPASSLYHINSAAREILFFNNLT